MGVMTAKPTKQSARADLMKLASLMLMVRLKERRHDN